MRQSFEERILRGERNTTVLGLFIKYGESKTGKRTALLKYVKDEAGKQIVDHIWITIPAFWPKDAAHRDWIKLRGMITTYLRANNTMDYQIGYLEWAVIHRKNVVALREQEEVRRIEEEKIRAEKERHDLLLRLLQGRVEYNRR